MIILKKYPESKVIFSEMELGIFIIAIEEYDGPYCSGGSELRYIRVEEGKIKRNKLLSEDASI